ncbi:MAG: hypothetical protein EZS28_007597 [Streblomastix strix]|uniref:Uncharacterized protein n=1 Tax=Streblomastix strix TaxID=222440 RepID=A0A5J4WP47_9EUKA|nr:MAG: hypothetical protein EZS28_007597 [Streblomastix strix]
MDIEDVQLVGDDSSEESKSDGGSSDLDIRIELEDKDDLFADNSESDDSDLVSKRNQFDLSNDDNEHVDKSDNESDGLLEIKDSDSDSSGIEPDEEIVKQRNQIDEQQRIKEMKEQEKRQQDIITSKLLQEFRERERLKKLEEKKPQKQQKDERMLKSPIDKTKGLEFYQKGMETDEQGKIELEKRKQQLIEEKQKQLLQQKLEQEEKQKAEQQEKEREKDDQQQKEENQVNAEKTKQIEQTKKDPSEMRFYKNRSTPEQFKSYSDIDNLDAQSQQQYQNQDLNEEDSNNLKSVPFDVPIYTDKVIKYREQNDKIHQLTEERDQLLLEIWNKETTLVRLETLMKQKNMENNQLSHLVMLEKEEMRRRDFQRGNQMKALQYQWEQANKDKDNLKDQFVELFTQNL